jgi:hypothetical protein
MSDEPVCIDVELPAAEAMALAQFVKRVSWREIRSCVVDDAECHKIRAALDKVQRALIAAKDASR